MSALLDNLPLYRRMTSGDLDAVLAIENEVYPHPWTRGNFVDSLAAGYHCWVMEAGGELVGHSVVMIALGEAHLLNLSIAARWQRRGLGREMLAFLIKLARDFLAHKVYLEVRPSNLAALRLYAGRGFVEIATRRGYYPTHVGREDAVMMELELK
jgi:ribosomal-protein-alanine N-acetyltransferase